MLYQLRKPVKNIEHYDDPPISNCPTPPVLTQDEKQTAGAQLAEAMGVKACQTNNHNFAANISFNAPFVSAGGAINYSDAATLGCEQLIAQANSYRTALQRIQCVMNNSQNVIKTTVTGVNSVKFEAGPYSTLIACGFDAIVKQGINIDVITSMNLNEQEINQISKEIKNVAEDVKNVIQSNISEAGATAAGGKQLYDSLNTIDNIDYDTKTRNAIRNLEMKVGANNSIIVSSKQGSYFKYAEFGTCYFDQNISVSIYASLVINNVLGEAFGSVVDQINTTKFESKQTTEGKGFAGQVKAFWDNYATVANVSMIVGAIIVVALVVGVVLVGPKLAKEFNAYQQGSGKQLF